MSTIRIQKRLESETLYLPELHALIGKNVEILVTEALAVPQAIPGSGNWDAAMQAVRDIEDYDYDAFQRQRDYDAPHAGDHRP